MGPHLIRINGQTGINDASYFMHFNLLVFNGNFHDLGNRRIGVGGSGTDQPVGGPGYLAPGRDRRRSVWPRSGSWNRAPFPQGGYNVVFVPMENGEITGDWEVFADGFKGAEPLMSPRDAVYRPTGVAEGPDGSLYVTDSMKGRVWRIVYAP